MAPDEVPAPVSRRRPAGVWVISLFYVLSAVWTIVGLVLVLGGTFPLPEAQKAYYASLSPVDYGFSLVLCLLTLAGAVMLFLLKRQAYALLLAAFVLGLGQIVYQIVAKNWLAAIGGPGLIGAFIGWGIGLAILLYARRLVGRGTLV